MCLLYQYEVHAATGLYHNGKTIKKELHMLQIISGKFFDSDDRFHTECKYVLYSNAFFRGKYQFAHITIESTESHSDIAAYIITYDNQLQKTYGGFQPIKVGDEEIAFQFKNIMAFVLDCIVDNDKNTVKNLCAIRSTAGGRVHNPADFISSTVTPKKDIADEDIKIASEITSEIIGLCREDYLNILNCIIAYNASINLLATDVSLAYSMLVYCLESLAQKYDHYNATWSDYNQEIKEALERNFQNIEANKVDEIKKLLISDGHFKLAQRFKNFVNANVSNSFFDNIPNRLTIGKDDFNVALNNAYIMRSKYAHMLNPIMNQLTDGEFSKVHDALEFQHNVYFTYSGLLRLTKEVITNFAFSQPQLKTEQISWYSQLPNSVEAELAPYFWIWKADYPNAKFALRKFEGLINCFVNYRNNIPIMDNLIFQYLDHLSEMAPENKSAAFSLCYIYYSCINGIEVETKEKMKLIIEKNTDLLKECNIYNIITAFFVGKIPDNIEWETADFLQAVEKYRKNKYRKASIKLPNAIELLLYLTLANSYKDDNDSVQQKVWLDIAYHNANNDGDIQKQIRGCIESKDMFSTGIIWDKINSQYLPPKDNA
jgi:hypothetical protein